MLELGGGRKSPQHFFFNFIFTFLFNESPVEYLRRAFSKEKKVLIPFLLHLYDLIYLNSTKSRLSNKKFTMGPEISLIQNSKINIDVKFQVSI